MHYPARKISIVFCFLFMLEFPYLLNVRSTDALLYANVYSMLFYPIMNVMMAKRYFFYVKYPVSYFFKVWTLPALIVLPLFYFAIRGGNVLLQYRVAIQSVAFVLAMSQLSLGMIDIRRRYEAERRKDEAYFSNEENFITQFATRLLKIVPAVIVIAVILPALIDTGQAKCVRDLTISVFCLWVLISTLPSRRASITDITILNEEERDLYDKIAPTKVVSKDNAPVIESTNLAPSAEDYMDKTVLKDDHEKSTEYNIPDGLLETIIALLVDGKLYQKTSLNLDDLAKAAGSNRKYVSQAIGNSPYQSFYKLVNGLRVKKALWIKETRPGTIQEEVAELVGFNSRYVLSRWLKLEQNGELPTFDNNIMAKIRS
jgi:YesN/AraC family two-component response regulator